MRRSCINIACFCVLCLLPDRLHATIIDSINANATPASNPVETIDWSSNGQGWFYTPTFSYTLTGIFTNFGQSNTALVTPEITVQIQTDRPGNGGTVLAEGSFEANSAQGGVGGASVGPISLVAGQSYFVDFLNDTGMGVNVGLWQNVNGVPMPSAGATVNLGDTYQDLVPSTGFSHLLQNGDYETFFATDGIPVQASSAEPILLFSGTVPAPEPSSIWLLAIGGAAIGVAVWRRSGRILSDRHG